MMQKPEDIPDDVWAASLQVSENINPTTILHDIVAIGAARAILAERERFTPLTVAVSGVVAEAAAISMTMRRRAIFARLEDAFTAIRRQP